MSRPSADAWWTRPSELSSSQAASNTASDLTLTTGSDPDAPTVVLPPPPVPGRPAGRGGASGRPSARVLGLAAVAAALVGAGVGALALRPGPPRTPVAPAAAQRVPASAVTARASSIQAPDGEITYDAANTLDGDLSTAWNSDGEKDGNGPGISLTYTFATPVALRDITVRNGYQKVRRRSGGSPVDLYPLNGRIRRFRVITDAGRWTWDLADARTAQTYSGASGRTRSVRLEIVTVYPSATYPDVALSEVSFTATDVASVSPPSRRALRRP